MTISMHYARELEKVIAFFFLNGMVLWARRVCFFQQIDVNRQVVTVSIDENVADIGSERVAAISTFCLQQPGLTVNHGLV